MTLRRNVPLALALVVLAVGCKKVNQESPASTLVFATFDSTKGVIPTPNDLALQATPKLPTSAQKELLQAFVTGGGFPADQEVAISVPFRAVTFDAATNLYKAAAPPVVDPKSVTPGNVAVYRISGTGAPERIIVTAETDPLDSSVLKIRKAADATGSRRWTPNARYVVAVRGGEHGVRTTTGLPVNADQAISLVAQNKDMTLPENQPPGGLPPATAASLDGLRKLLWNAVPWCYTGAPAWIPVTSTAAAGACAKPAEIVQPAESAFGAVSFVIPAADVAAIATFQVAPTSGTYALVDSGSGQAPLPFDLLRNPTTGKVVNNPAFGAAAAGLATLDGFSTTAMLMAPVSAPIQADSVKTGVYVYHFDTSLTTPAWVRIHDLKAATGTPAYVSQPTPIVTAQNSDVVPGVTCPSVGGCSLLVGIQPAYPVDTSGTGSGPFVYLPPLKEGGEYAVVISNGVTDILGQPLKRSTVAKILLEEIGTSPVYLPQNTGPCSTAGGCSLLSGIDPVTANALQTMRGALAPVLTQFEADSGKTKADVALAYTVHTQATVALANTLVAAFTGTVEQGWTLATPAEVAAAYGFPSASLPPAAFQTFADVKFQTNNLLLASANGGAFDPTHPTPETVTALVALPTAAAVSANPTFRCAGGGNCAPLVVFRHGITRAKGDMLAIAAALASNGFVVASFDAEKHGDRTLCTSDTQCNVAVGATCNTTKYPALRTPADATPVGVCVTADGTRAYLNYRLDCKKSTPDLSCLSASAATPSVPLNTGIPYASGNLFVSGNLFRTRDTLRQDMIDTRSLIIALTEAPASGNFANQVASYGYALDSTKVYLVGQSLGSIMGSLSTAVAPEISRAVFNVPGATVVDIFASPASGFHPALIDLLGKMSPPIAENTSEYLKFLQVAKWILDPADPSNFGAVAATRIGTSNMLSQFALCDRTIPNPQNQFFAASMGLTVPAPDPSASPTAIGNVQWFLSGTSGTDCASNAVDHGFLLAPTAVTSKAQGAVVNFLATGAAQTSTVRP